MGAIGLPRAVADPEKMRRGAVPIAASGIDAGKRLLIAKEKGLVACIEVRRAELRHQLRSDSASLHEGEGLADARRQCAIALAGGRAGNEIEGPAMDIV